MSPAKKTRASQRSPTERAQTLEAAAAEPQAWELRLYVAGKSPKSVA